MLSLSVTLIYVKTLLNELNEFSTIINDGLTRLDQFEF